MNNKILTYNDYPELQPIVEIEHTLINTAQYPFKATTLDEAKQWQAECRKALVDTLGFIDSHQVDPEPVVIEEVEREDHLRRKIIIRTSEFSKMPVYLLIPKINKEKYPVILAYAGHGYGVKDIVGLNQDGTERDELVPYQFDFALQLCRLGFLVAAPEIACFGERQNDFSDIEPNLVPGTCNSLAFYAIAMGKSAIGFRVRDSLRLVDYLTSLPETDVNNIGAMGISGGGMLTFFHTAIDERIKTCAISGYFCYFKHSIHRLIHCACNFAPNLLRIAEEPDLAGLILPRPFCVEAGTDDGIFPIWAVRSAVNEVKRMCEVFSVNPEKTVVFHEFEGPHQINGQVAFPFLVGHLQDKST